MAEQERIQKSKSQHRREEVMKEAEVAAQVDAEAEKLKAETDDLLDEIDSLLEENAQDFVANYIQKGGQ